MKYYELDKEEEKTLANFENGKLARVKNVDKQKKLYQQYAAASLNKTRNINIRVSERDLQKLKSKAAKVGIPYQTLVSSVLHQSTNE